MSFCSTWWMWRRICPTFSKIPGRSSTCKFLSRIIGVKIWPVSSLPPSASLVIIRLSCVCATIESSLIFLTRNCAESHSGEGREREIDKFVMFTCVCRRCIIACEKERDGIQLPAQLLSSWQQVFFFSLSLSPFSFLFFFLFSSPSFLSLSLLLWINIPLSTRSCACSAGELERDLSFS